MGFWLEYKGDEIVHFSDKQFDPHKGNKICSPDPNDLPTGLLKGLPKYNYKVVETRWVGEQAAIPGRIEMMKITIEDRMDEREANRIVKLINDSATTELTAKTAPELEAK